MMTGVVFTQRGWAILSLRIYSFLINRKKERERKGGVPIETKKITDPEKNSRNPEKKKFRAHLPTSREPRLGIWTDAQNRD